MPIQLSVSGFGPIDTADIAVEPLTVLVGPNNSGKSTLAMLIYAATQLTPYQRQSRSDLDVWTEDEGDWIYIPSRQTWTSDDSSVQKSLSTYLAREHRHGYTFELPPDIVLSSLEKSARRQVRLYITRVGREIERAFGARIDSLRRVVKREPFPIRLTIRHGDPEWSASLTHTPTSPSPQFRVDSVPAVQHLWPLIRHPLQRLSPDALGDITPQAFLAALEARLTAVLFGEFPPWRYYLPAARSGILQSHKALASFVVGRASLAGVEEMDIPKMTGVIGDFISRLLDINLDHRTEFDSVARKLEHDVLEGHVRVRGRRPAYPEISYESSMGRLPLHRTSSMVSELAPVVLFIRHLLDPGELIILEEPESHLHPTSQLRVAKAMARLVNGGAHVVLTTHSDYFLGQLNNSIRAHSARPSVRRAQQFAPAECLNPTKVGAYAIKPTDHYEGSTVRRISISPEDGISEEEFEPVAASLYESTVRLFEDVADAPA